MGSFSREALALASANGQQPVLIIDQSTISQHDRHELVMVALRVRKRAIPIAWGVYKASGSLGWKEQSEVLETARSFLPDGCKPMLMGDRFYGNGETISWCQTHGWDYCLRLKGSLVLTPDLETAPDQERIFYDPSTDPKSAYHFSGRCTISALWAAGGTPISGRVSNTPPHPNQHPNVERQKVQRTVVYRHVKRSLAANGPRIWQTVGD